MILNYDINLQHDMYLYIGHENIPNLTQKARSQIVIDYRSYQEVDLTSTFKKNTPVSSKNQNALNPFPLPEGFYRGRNHPEPSPFPSKVMVAQPHQHQSSE